MDKMDRTPSSDILRENSNPIFPSQPPETPNLAPNIRKDPSSLDLKFAEEPNDSEMESEDSFWENPKDHSANILPSSPYTFPRSSSCPSISFHAKEKKALDMDSLAKRNFSHSYPKSPHILFSDSPLEQRIPRYYPPTPPNSPSLNLPPPFQTLEYVPPLLQNLPISPRQKSVQKPTDSTTSKRFRIKKVKEVASSLLGPKASDMKGSFSMKAVKRRVASRITKKISANTKFSDHIPQSLSRESSFHNEKLLCDLDKALSSIHIRD